MCIEQIVAYRSTRSEGVMRMRLRICKWKHAVKIVTKEEEIDRNPNTGKTLNMYMS